MTYRPRLSHSAIVSSQRLLPMAYKVSEISEILSVENRTLRDWLANGAPHTRNKDGRIWIHGREFAEWVQKNRKHKRTTKLRDDQAYCFRCKMAVTINNPTTKPVKGKLLQITGECQHCGTKIVRGGRDANPS